MLAFIMVNIIIANETHTSTKYAPMKNFHIQAHKMNFVAQKMTPGFVLLVGSGTSYVTS